MATEIKQSQLRNDNAEVMRRVAEGESFVVTVNGRPVADVIPHRAARGRRQFVPAAELARDLEPLPAADVTAWLSDLAEAREMVGPDEPSDPWDRQPR